MKKLNEAMPSWQAERELDLIRAKDMTPEQRREFFRKQHEKRTSIYGTGYDLSAAEQAWVDAEMKKMDKRKAERIRSHFSGIDPTSPRYAGRRNEAGVRSDLAYQGDLLSPEAQRKIRAAQVQDDLGQVPAPRYGDATHPSRTGTRGSTYQVYTGVNFGRGNPQRERAIEQMLADKGRRAEFDAMSDEDLQKEVDQQISRDIAADLKAISDRHAEKGMEKYGIKDRDVYDERYKNYQDAMKAERAAYRDDPKTHQYEDDIADLTGQRSSARGEERYAINRQIAQRKREESRRRRKRKRDAGLDIDTFMTTPVDANEHYFPTSPSEFVTMLREQYK